MKNKIILSDSYIVNDSHSKTRGIVIIKDENGKVIIRKENMIVENGRRYLLNKIFGSDKRTIDGIRFGSGKNSNGVVEVVKPTDTGLINDLSVAVKSPISNEIDTNAIANVFKFDISLADVNAEESRADIGEIGLFLSDGSMFSRLIFEPFILQENSVFTIEYTIYF